MYYSLMTALSELFRRGLRRLCSLAVYVVVDLALREDEVKPTEAEEAQYQVQHAAAFKLLPELIHPIERIDTAGYYGEQQRHTTARRFLFGANRVTVVGKFYKPIQTINTERYDREQYAQCYVTLFHKSNLLQDLTLTASKVLYHVYMSLSTYFVLFFCFLLR